jgi:hypothetical protein
MQSLRHCAVIAALPFALAGCATDGSFSLEPPPRTERSTQRPLPYDPFGFGEPVRPQAPAQGATVQGEGLGARPAEAVAASAEAYERDPAVASSTGRSGDGQNTVPKSRVAALTAPSVQSAEPAAPIESPGIPQSGFVGLSADDLKAQWGAPALTRTEAGGAVWQFQGRGCVVLAYLYPNAAGVLETAYAEARPGGAAEDAVRACMRPQAGAKAPAKPRKPRTAGTP